MGKRTKNETIDRYAEFKRDILENVSNRDLIRKYNKNKDTCLFSRYVSKMYKDLTGIEKNFNMNEARIMVKILQMEYKNL